MKNIQRAAGVTTLCLSLLAVASFAEGTTQPNNTVVNKRDTNPGAVTADNQAQGSKSDVEMTRLIRRALTKDSSLSTSAHNIKIITLNGAVTLRGPVKSEEEKTKVASIASETAGKDKTVTNNLDILK